MADDLLNALAGSAPDPGPETVYSRLRGLHEALTRNVLEPAQYALFYPPRVLGRYMDPSGVDPFWNSRSMPGQRQMTPADWQMAGDVAHGVGRLGTYAPGDRESEHVEVRGRPSSIWQW